MPQIAQTFCLAEHRDSRASDGDHPGFRFQKCLEGGRIKSVTALARQEHMDRPFLFRALSLVNLAPDIIKLILNGIEPKTLTLNKLRKGFPEDWSEQRKFFRIK